MEVRPHYPGSETKPVDQRGPWNHSVGTYIYSGGDPEFKKNKDMIP